MTHSGKDSARRPARDRVPLKSRRGWKDAGVAEEVEVSIGTVERERDDKAATLGRRLTTGGAGAKLKPLLPGDRSGMTQWCGEASSPGPIRKEMHPCPPAPTDSSR